MNASELRIGNYVEIRLKSGQGRVQIGKIRCQDIVRIYENTGSFNYQPIPLTKEWLLKFGFEKFNHSVKEYWAINDFEIEIHCNKFPIRICGGESSPHLTQFIGHGTKYVHQLQNIYFALTGEELKIKE